MDIRNATQADLPSILRLVNTAFEVERFFKNQDRLSAEDLESHFRSGAFLVTEDAGAITGCIYVTRNRDRAYFGLLAIDPARQKTGIGRRLVAAAEEFARETGARFMDIRIINLRTELPGIYEKLGYRITGSAPYPSERNHMLTQPVHFICMSKELGHRP
ncbi:MAG TPA: GNAT family N-acetyltransferase [Acidobacteriaceae bacterium]|nr:GNAT family N-acetyltransferase [Acidobacteriaceae bacterium]